jgi:hypothetical protein
MGVIVRRTSVFEEVRLVEGLNPNRPRTLITF